MVAANGLMATNAVVVVVVVASDQIRPRMGMIIKKDDVFTAVIMVQEKVLPNVRFFVRIEKESYMLK